MILDLIVLLFMRAKMRNEKEHDNDQIDNSSTINCSPYTKKLLDVDLSASNSFKDILDIEEYSHEAEKIPDLLLLKQIQANWDQDIDDLIIA